MSRAHLKSRKIQARLRGSFSQKDRSYKQFIKDHTLSGHKKDQKLIMEMWDNYLTFTGLGI